MKLTDILSKECIRIPLEATEKTAAIAELVDVLAEQGKISDRDPVLQAVLDREATRPTAVGHGLAVPHGKSAGSPKLVMAVGKSAGPLDYGGKDDEPVHLIVLVCGPPDQTGPHIQALARIARLVLIDKFRSAVDAAKGPDDLYDVILRYEM